MPKTVTDVDTQLAAVRNEGRQRKGGGVHLRGRGAKRCQGLGGSLEAPAQAAVITVQMSFAIYVKRQVIFNPTAQSAPR